MAFATLALSAIGTVVSVAGTIMGGMAQQAQAEYQAKVAENNAKVAAQASEMERLRGDEEAHNQDLRNREIRAKQRAALGASGVAVDTGSALDVQETSAVLGRMDTLTVKNNSDQRAVALKNQAITFQNEAGLARAKGDNAMMAGFIGGASSLIGGASSFADKWTKLYPNTSIF